MNQIHVYEKYGCAVYLCLGSLVLLVHLLEALLQARGARFLDEFEILDNLLVYGSKKV